MLLVRPLAGQEDARRLNCYGSREIPGNSIDFDSKSIDKASRIAYTELAGRDTLYTHVTELTFKCYVIAAVVGNRREAAFFV